MKLLERGVRTEVPRASGELQHQAEEPELSSCPHLTEVAAPVLPEPQHKGRLGEAFVYDVHSMSLLGKSPKEARASIRAALEPGFYISCSGKKKVRSLHQLGKCYLLPGVDFMNYTFAGNTVCRLCARVGVQDGGDSSATVSSLPKQLPPAIAAALQSGPGRVWTPVLVRDQPWLYDSASRSHLSSSCWGFFGFLVFGLSPVPGLAFPGVSAPCVRGCACAGTCVCVCLPCLGLCGPFSISALLVLLRWPPLGPGRACLFVGVLPGSVFGPVSWGFFSPGSRKTHGGRTSHKLRKSSKLRAQRISRAKVESHSLSTLSVYQMARSELRL